MPWEPTVTTNTFPPPSLPLPLSHYAVHTHSGRGTFNIARTGALGGIRITIHDAHGAALADIYCDDDQAAELAGKLMAVAR